MNLTQSIIDEINANAENADATEVDIAKKCLMANPFTKEHWNLTLQCRISERMPIFAKVLEDRAKTGTPFDENEIAAWNKTFPSMKVQRHGSNYVPVLHGFEHSAGQGTHQ